MQISQYVCSNKSIIFVLALVFGATFVINMDFHTVFFEKLEVDVALVPESGALKKTDWDAAHNSFLYNDKLIDDELPAFRDSKHIDILNSRQPEYLTTYLNPCWYEQPSNGSSPKAHCTPYAYLAGFPKAGTTDVYSRLIRHPHILSACTKEPHWWAMHRFGGSMWGNGMMSQYTSCFPADHILGSNFSNGEKKIYIDASAETVWYFRKWRNIPQNNQSDSEPTFTTPHCIHHFNPDAKIIILLRNPIDRSYSGYNYFGKTPPASPDLFHNRSLDAIRAYEECIEKNSVKYCIISLSRTIADLGAYKNPAQQEPRLTVSMYIFFIEQWLSVFPRDQIMFIRTEDYNKDVNETMKSLFQFLNMDEPSVEDWEKITDPRKHNVGRSHRPMLNKTRTLLQGFFQPFNKQLAMLLGDKRYLWEDS